MTFEEIVHYRRSVRFYKDIQIDSLKVKHCLELASLAPNSSNMQLWEFYHITDSEINKKLSVACLNQNAAVTAKQLVVFITRQDLYLSRTKKIIDLVIENITKSRPKEKHESRIKKSKIYYTKIMPFIYSQFFGVIGFFRVILVNLIGIFRPIFYEVSENDSKVVVHKSCALAAQTFMLAMANEGLDTCPMEGFDSKLVKRILKLPYGAEVNMIISCGVRDEKGVWGERIRIPFNEIYKEI